MRFLIGVVLMASGLFGIYGAEAAQSGKVGAPRPNAMKQEAPSQNPLDAVMDDIYRREMAGQITHDQAMDIYGEAVSKATPEQIRQHGENMLKRR